MVATLFKQLRFAGVPIVTLAEGEITELHVGLKGTMNALLLKDLAAKTHHGLRGRVCRGNEPAERRASGDGWRAELAKIEKQIQGIVEAIKDGCSSGR
jgi:hypothetical protein